VFQCAFPIRPKIQIIPPSAHMQLSYLSTAVLRCYANFHHALFTLCSESKHRYEYCIVHVTCGSAHATPPIYREGHPLHDTCAIVSVAIPGIESWYSQARFQCLEVSCICPSPGKKLPTAGSTDTSERHARGYSVERRAESRLYQAVDLLSRPPS
jgi:hypothetical protein